jgi:hypothetical protein
MFLQFLSFILVSLASTSHAAVIQHQKPPKIYTILLPDQTRRSVKLVNGYSVSRLFHEYFHCHHENIDQLNNTTQQPFLSDEDCIRFMDRVSEDYYGLHYTPSLSRCTIEDFYSDHTDLLIYLTQRFQYKSYLEIRSQGNNQKNFMAETGEGSARGGEGIIQPTSDEFFQQNDQLYELIFLDGNRSAEELWRELKNCLLVLPDHGTIVIRNLNPRLKDHSEQPKITSSDGWKVAITMRLARYYEIVVVDIDQGCGVIRRRKNMHPLPDDFVKKLQEYSTLPGETLPGTHSLTFEEFDRQRSVFYRLMTLLEMREWLEEEN